MVREEDLFRAVERFGTTLEGAGMPRMASRVFAYVLAEDRDRYTARELAEGLHISPAAVSGAVRYLVDARLLLKERKPGGRGDLYAVTEGDVWSTIMLARLPMVEGFVAAVEDAMEMLDEGSPGHRRLAETRDFFAFTVEDMSGVVERWQAWKAAHGR
jgi:DNA-binding transcriptional regulator GbsR (MarR family)